MNINSLSIKEAREKLIKKEISSLELTKACLSTIGERDKEIKTCLNVFEKEAILAAKEADKRIASGDDDPLLGIPYLAKDNLMVKGQKTTAGSLMLKNYISPYNSFVIDKLDKAGAILLGKTNLDEFAHGSSTENSAFFSSHNPYDLSRTPGGSSGGSAAALAADMCLFSLGSDTGGSIRQPASFCNLVGLKPSYGLVSRFGLIAMTSSTDVIGPFTKNIYDSALVLQAIADYDKRDATCLKNKRADYLVNIEKKIKDLTIAYPRQYFDNTLSQDILELLEKAKDKFKNLGAKIIEVDLNYADYSVPTYYIITPSEISSNLARFDGISWGLSKKEYSDLKEFYTNNRGAGFGLETKRRIMLGTFALSAGYLDKYYKQALVLRQLIKEDFKKVFSKADIIISPSTIGPAFKLGDKINDTLAMYKEDIYLAGVSLAGLPALSMPAGFLTKDGKELPIGLQLIAPYLQEEKLLQVAFSLEKANI